MLELAMSNMVEREPLRELLLDKGKITEVEFVARFGKPDRGKKRKGNDKRREGV